MDVLLFMVHLGFFLHFLNEMFLSMMSAFAQEESISISKNMRKGAVMRMKNGTFRLSQAPYGYYLDEKGILIVQQEESKIVQRIFGNFLSGMGIQEIAAELQKEHIPKLNGEPIWSYTGILYILTNERYILLFHCYLVRAAVFW